jgi:hypothetical protein
VQFSGYARRFLLLLLASIAGRINRRIRNSFRDAPQDTVQHCASNQHKSNQEEQFYEGPEHLNL